MPQWLVLVLTSLVNKKKILGYVGAAVLAVMALIAGVNSKELKDEVCGREALEIKPPQIEIVAPKELVAPKDAVKEIKK